MKEQKDLTINDNLEQMTPQMREALRNMSVKMDASTVLEPGTDNLPDYVEPTEEQKEKLRQYWTKVIAGPDRRSDQTPLRYFENKLEYESDERAKSAKHLIFRLFQREETRRVTRGDHSFSFRFTEGNYSEVLRNLIRFFINDRTGPLPIDNWIYIWGKVGCGKTLMMNILRAFCEDHNNQKMFMFSDTPAIPATVKATPDTLRMLTCWDMCFDDAGFKIAPVAWENENINPLEYILWKRFFKWEHSRQLTYFTSNLPLSLFLERFDERLQDRVRSCTTEIQLTGGSMRQIIHNQNQSQ